MLDPILIAALVGGYLLGSIPFGLVLTQLAGLGDIRNIGSGNIGATNVLRTGNKALAAATLILDGAKGAVAALIVLNWGVEAALLAGFAAVLGHLYPVWLRFQGGKGVATTLGCLIALDWQAGVGACVTWLIIAAVFRISSLSALVAMAASPVLVWFLPMPDFSAAARVEVALFAAALAALVWAKHHANIRRLLQGSEPRIGAGKHSHNA